MATDYTSLPKTKAQEAVLGRMSSYNDVVDYLSSCKSIEYSENSLNRMNKLNELFENIKEKVDVILVGGTNGKSSTINFASKLLKEEGFKVGASYSSNLLTYNERINIDSEQISNKQFGEIVGEVINTAEINNIKATTFEILTMASLLYFKAENVDVVFLEVGLGGKLDATNICNPKISVITRVAEDNADIFGEDVSKITSDMMDIAKKDSWFVSAEQSKLRLKKMQEMADFKGAKWLMPIRKLSSLPYIFEQLYGRSASLAERVAQIYTEEVRGKFSPFLRGNLLPTRRGQRGRPTLEAKKKADENPLKTLKSFWNEEFNLLRGRFEILDKEKPSILLDTAHNVDALDNLFLGIRLLHYKRAINGLTLIMGLNDYHRTSEVMRQVRYLLKKVNGQVYFVPLSNQTPCHEPIELEKIANELGLKSKSFKTFEEAFEAAKLSVDGRLGLIGITGSPLVVSEYWKYKNIKKLS
jgi:dihydrofolate synthase / folylpolyglutamate synthase